MNLLLIPVKILRKLFFLLKQLKYDQNTFEKIQNNKFNCLNFKRLESKKKLEKLKKEYNFLSRGMSSEHELLFYSIAIQSKNKIKNILEIGTFDGANAFLLSKIFKSAKIDTIDLSKKDKDFQNFYNRKNNLKKFIKERDKLLKKNKNIKFQEINSIKLILSKKKYDLIWIDGAHGYPTCCIDIINSLKLINKNGFILVDDILLKNHHNDRIYNSVAGFETLKELEKNQIIKFELFYKRLDAKYNYDKNKLKYIALVKKTKI